RLAHDGVVLGFNLASVFENENGARRIIGLGRFGFTVSYLRLDGRWRRSRRHQIARILTTALLFRQRIPRALEVGLAQSILAADHGSVTVGGRFRLGSLAHHRIGNRLISEGIVSWCVDRVNDWDLRKKLVMLMDPELMEGRNRLKVEGSDNPAGWKGPYHKRKALGGRRSGWDRDCPWAQRRRQR